MRAPVVNHADLKDEKKTKMSEKLIRVHAECSYHQERVNKRYVK
jgi:hypothetical protein